MVSAVPSAPDCTTMARSAATRQSRKRGSRRQRIMIGRNHGSAHMKRVGTRYVLAPLVAVMSFVVLLRFGRYHGGESEDIFLAADEFSRTEAPIAGKGRKPSPISVSPCPFKMFS